MNSWIHRYCFLLISVVAVSGCRTANERTKVAAHDMGVSYIPSNYSGPPKVVVNLGEQKAVLFREGLDAVEAPISSGRDGYPTPTGRFSVIRMEPSHRSGVYGDYVDGGGQVVVSNVDVRSRRQPGGTHFLGASMPYFMEFTPGYGLHAGYLPGYPASHGCVRLPYAGAQLFYNAVHIGTSVTVTH
jgi:lipoprotein-anchoring transpeptidase ErfK/SrfK